MLLKRWEPFADIRRADRDIDRFWRHMFRPTYQWPRNWDGNGYLPIDVYNDGDNLVVRAELPGFGLEDVDVTITENTLTIKGEHKVEKEVKEENYLHREHRAGAFRRSITLPRDLDTEKAAATHENGILTVTIPKSEEAKPKTLKVEVKSLTGSKS